MAPHLLEVATGTDGVYGEHVSFFDSTASLLLRLACLLECTCREMIAEYNQKENE